MTNVIICIKNDIKAHGQSSCILMTETQLSNLVNAVMY